MGHCDSDTRSPSEIKGKPCLCSKGLTLNSVIMIFVQNGCVGHFYGWFEYGSFLVEKTS